ncbi:hydantoinase/carbamoylase family amidase [Pinisolibacter aquiterrae]|uniref:hydantoinase/carbamoylase family amidase n=1 Tax=Pinisolibacter aquiterrae TaxID=2815579 RepID=UPI001C3DBE17|nr:hydantoinase/carbamoylase family amidase [Pinisolibacter aquiterrae]MBV5265217.1 hydantoinase/carbamoylase family amidase [Pinisolibacter aquiterrae]MCC8235453.1 hydantoinase/carbamoylase family amidase [Pinisolibacter aquiterrae]
MAAATARPSDDALRVATAVDGDRLWRRIEELAAFGALPGGGVNRQALSEAEVAARRHLLAIAEARGLAVFADAAGNLFLRLEGRDPALPPVLSGSHLDTQPTGGRFDGVWGVLAALEVLEALRDRDLRPRRSIEMVAWMNEEGSRFAPGMMGSEAFAGHRDLAEIRATTDATGVTVGEALDRLVAALPPVPERPLGFPLTAYVEAHIEQGPLLEAAGRTIGVVTGIQGKQTMRVTVTGEEAHAGTRAMAERRDALMGALRVVDALAKIAAEADPAMFFTVGRFDVFPNAPSVVPGRVRFSTDLRHAETELLRTAGARQRERAATAAAPCAVTVEPLVDAAASVFAPTLRARIAGAAEALDLSAMDILSAAGHDARHMVDLAPSAMIFVPSRGGVSHAEHEWTDPADVVAGTRVLAAVLWDLAEAEAPTSIAREGESA